MEGSLIRIQQHARKRGLASAGRRRKDEQEAAALQFIRLMGFVMGHSRYCAKGQGGVKREARSAGDESGLGVLALFAFVIDGFGYNCAADEQQARNRAGRQACSQQTNARAKQAMTLLASNNFANNGSCDGF